MYEGTCPLIQTLSGRFPGATRTARFDAPAHDVRVRRWFAQPSRVRWIGRRVGAADRRPGAALARARIAAMGAECPRRA
eukprot:scaffold5393_cov376-Prasinococcus_capsulatus_cf.AAC.4